MPSFLKSFLTEVLLYTVTYLSTEKGTFRSNMKTILVSELQLNTKSQLGAKSH